MSTENENRRSSPQRTLGSDRQLDKTSGCGETTSIFGANFRKQSPKRIPQESQTALVNKGDSKDLEGNDNHRTTTNYKSEGQENVSDDDQNIRDKFNITNGFPRATQLHRLFY